MGHIAYKEKGEKTMVIKAGNMDHYFMENILRSKNLNPKRYVIHYESKDYHIEHEELFCAMSMFYVVATPKKGA